LIGVVFDLVEAWKRVAEGIFKWEKCLGEYLSLVKWYIMVLGPSGVHIACALIEKALLAVRSGFAVPLKAGNVIFTGLRQQHCLVMVLGPIGMHVGILAHVQRPRKRLFYTCSGERGAGFCSPFEGR
jgi:hypothetical protein